MSMNIRAAVAVGAVALLWVGLAYNLSRPGNYRTYHRTMLQVAAAAHDAAQTGRLTGEQLLAHRVTTPYAHSAFNDAIEALAGAQKQFASHTPPDMQSSHLGDQLSPLLAQEVIALGNTAQAADDTSLRTGIGTLDTLAERLDAFITAHR
jgi:hypothetical protein